MLLRRLSALGAAVALVGLDLFTKDLAFVRLKGMAAIEVIPGFWNWRYAENRDVGFGLLRFIPEELRFMLIVALVTTGLIVVLVYGWRHAQRTVALSGSALIAAGALGNLVNRWQSGFVIDFVHWYLGSFSWPIFNLADVYVVCGVALLLWHEWKNPPVEASELEANSSAEETPQR